MFYAGQGVAAWSWLVEKLPSDLPEDLALTHDYISVVFELDNGRDLTDMWSRCMEGRARFKDIRAGAPWPMPAAIWNAPAHGRSGNPMPSAPFS
nr:DUF3047 domain-containing protein [Novacetimonas pomaceti]